MTIQQEYNFLWFLLGAAFGVGFTGIIGVMFIFLTAKSPTIGIPNEYTASLGVKFVGADGSQYRQPTDQEMRDYVDRMAQ